MYFFQLKPAQDFIYYGLGNGDGCYCGNDDSKFIPAPSSECDSPCSGDQNQICGGAWRLNVFQKTCDRGLCGDDWCQIEETCYKLLDDFDQKDTLKSLCHTEGAVLVAPMSEAENENLWEFLDLVDFQGEEVWLGLNDGKNEGTYVKDNTKNPVVYIDWFNWDENAENNTDPISSAKYNFERKTWFRTNAQDYAYAVCTKAV